MTPNDLRAMRLKAGISQEELARRLGYNHRSTISLLESGKRYINPRMQVGIEAVLKMEEKRLQEKRELEDTINKLEKNELKYLKALGYPVKSGAGK
jgi:transcriptional regulator with XRE-family HTH domain